MRSNFHESYAQGAVKPPSERSTGLVFVAIALMIAYLKRDQTWIASAAVGAAFALALVALFAPRVLRPLNLLWFRFSMLLHRIVNPIVMFTIFALVFVPAGLLMRLLRDPLRAKRDPGAATYWVERTQDGAASSMQHQF